ncbi:hypothetical protein J7L02_02680 [Candidatus Woesearchaeota archaeon]|nr:hypothetical protein [Candidatus Woesearchaeota archaeon]
MKPGVRQINFVSIQEGALSFKLPRHEGVPRKAMKVFYNPEMVFNRDLTILALKAFKFLNQKIEGLKIGLPLAASGVRGFRILLEAREVVDELFLNDKNPNACKVMKQIFKSLKVSNPELKKFEDKTHIYCLEADLFLTTFKPFHYVDIDPFGTPNPYLDVAIKSCNSLLAVTATDTAVLAGAYPKTCKRAYWALPLKNYLKHEAGLRILIRKAQLIGCQYGKALQPVMSYWSKHYYRVFFKIVKSKFLCDKIVSQHLLVDEQLKPVTVEKHVQGYGPLWVGVLNNEEFLKAMLRFAKILNFDKAVKFLNDLLLEASVNSLGFVDVHNVASVEKLSRIPSIESIVQELKARGFKASRTLFSNTGVKTNADEEAVKEVIKKLSNA